MALVGALFCAHFSYSVGFDLFILLRVFSFDLLNIPKTSFSNCISGSIEDLCMVHKNDLLHKSRIFIFISLQLHHATNSLYPRKE